MLVSKIEKLIDQIKVEWSTPRYAVHKGKEIPFLLHCSINDREKLIMHDLVLPKNLSDFYRISDNATFFKDEKHGQWGLNILSLSEAFEKTKDFEVERKRDFKKGDLIVGEFIGDSDFLLIRCDSSSADFGNVVLVNPIDPRGDWSMIANDFEKFLLDYYQSQGDKFWEYE